ncbi:hypothetical protein GBA65_02355 [Rubrobacter marinus]|uniref:Uncharacterized protein n=1 Tax=Rubrobacter marinus TaxID=2653852 RepID=A0A6G8PSR3_9ACTN|nr:hypothetical protein [Rubrobacter marinus]QIN77538.1 hypothetical protein GBA65_02355 [Rubrobacter marinus]
MTQDEFEALMADADKRIEQDVSWTEDENHSPAVQFRVQVESQAGYPLFVKGFLNRASQKLSYVLVHRPEGRIYGLDLGQAHRNPDRQLVGADKHKHRWSERTGVKEVYVPEDITATFAQPIEVWKQFCTEARLVHNGVMNPPPSLQMGMLL